LKKEFLHDVLFYAVIAIIITAVALTFIVCISFFTGNEGDSPYNFSVIESTFISGSAEEFSANVYVTANGKKYHASAECAYLKKSKDISEIPVKTAVDNGLEACSGCFGD